MGSLEPDAGPGGWWPWDWPKDGPINLAEQDLPHASADTEWWYINTHFRTDQGRNLSLFAAFFRSHWTTETGRREYSHALTWALSDPQSQWYSGHTRVDTKAPQIMLQKLNEGYGPSDSKLNRAMREIAEAGKVVGPETMFSGPVSVGEKVLDIDFGDDAGRFQKIDEGVYRLTLASQERGVGCDLTIRLQKKPVRQGDNGVVRGKHSEVMFYYFIPRCSLEGSVRLDHRQPHSVISGAAWYDHEFGVRSGGLESLSLDETVGNLSMWKWAGIQLSNNVEINAYLVVDGESGRNLVRRAVVVEADGSSKPGSDIAFQPRTTWLSMRTFEKYPINFRLVSEALGLDLEVTAAFEDQELITTISYPGFWEGRVNVSGTYNGSLVHGLGFVELTNVGVDEKLETFFSKVGSRVSAIVDDILPPNPTPQQMIHLFADAHHPQYLSGVAPSVLTQHLITPIRAIASRGGKAWRPYAALACCDAVGGDSRAYSAVLALPELLHVGSLIVDDVQDGSATRRGGPSCHALFGVPLAINAGNAAYFLWQPTMAGMDLRPGQRVRLYELFFLAVRAGHAGQALDLGGMYDLMPGIVEGDSVEGASGTTGEASGIVKDDSGADALQARILACYRLKSGVPAAVAAGMGAVLGDASEAQVDGLMAYFEAVGTAFQVMDDVLNLRGFERDLKTKGEDVSNGMITLPVARAMVVLDSEKRRWLWETLQSKPTEQSVIREVVQMLEECGAVDACAKMASDMVEEGWKKVCPFLVPSMSTMMLRAFGWLVIERHY